jgi:hypothetical protein
LKAKEQQEQEYVEKMKANKAKSKVSAVNLCFDNDMIEVLHDRESRRL